MRWTRRVTSALATGGVLLVLATPPETPAGGEADPDRDTPPVADKSPDAENGTSWEPRASWLRIDGEDWRGPVTQEVNDLAIGPSGALWVATNGGLSRLTEGRFRHFTRANRLPHEQVFALEATPHGVLVATRGGLAWIDDLAPPDEMSPRTVETGFVQSLIEHVASDTYWYLLTEPESAAVHRVTLDSDGEPQDVEPVASFDRRVRAILPGMGDVAFSQTASRRWYSYRRAFREGAGHRGRPARRAVHLKRSVAPHALPAATLAGR